MILEIALINSSIGLVFLAMAVIMLYFPPKKINDIYGYRTDRSRKSQAHWDFSQRFSAWRMIEIGVVMIAVGVGLSMLETALAFMFVSLIALVMGGCLYMYVRTESALKKKFPG